MPSQKAGCLYRRMLVLQSINIAAIQVKGSKSALRREKLIWSRNFNATCGYIDMSR